MEIVLALLFGAAIGGVAHAVLPARPTRGVALGPIGGALVGGLVWMLLTWAGAGLDDPWLWVLSIAAPAVVVFPALAVLTRVRSRHDQRERLRLKIA